MAKTQTCSDRKSWRRTELADKRDLGNVLIMWRIQTTHITRPPELEQQMAADVQWPSGCDKRLLLERGQWRLLKNSSILIHRLESKRPWVKPWIYWIWDAWGACKWRCILRNQFGDYLLVDRNWRYRTYHGHSCHPTRIPLSCSRHIIIETAAMIVQGDFSIPGHS